MRTSTCRPSSLTPLAVTVLLFESTAEDDEASRELDEGVLPSIREEKTSPTCMAVVTLLLFTFLLFLLESCPVESSIIQNRRREEGETSTLIILNKKRKIRFRFTDAKLVTETLVFCTNRYSQVGLDRFVKNPNHKNKYTY